jgi:hypothetical protein
MNSCMKKVCVSLLILLFPVMFLACSGGGSGSGGDGTATTSLQVADKVSVVDAKLSGSVAAAAPLHIGLFKVTAADLAAASDYKADKTQVYVSERSAEAFNEINNILCMVSQTKGDAMLNKGAYVALVDQTQCDTSKSDASSAGQDSQNQSSSSNMPDYTTFTVLATRTDNNSPEYLKVWVHMKQKGSDPEQIILVNLTITEGKSDTNPYGLFTMDFLGHPSTNGVMDTSQISFKGVMKAERNAAGEVLLKFAEENYGGYPCTRKITLNRQGDGSSGTGSVYDQHNEMNSGITTTVTSQFDIAFNTDNFLRNDGTTTICLDRNQFEESAWRYGLYDTAGTRLNRNSGFSVNTKADGSGSYGFVGYWGLWLDNNATITNNTLYKFDYSSANAAPIAYTIFTAGGKLKKHTKKMMTLADIKGVPLNYSECDQINGCMNYQVVWDSTNFNKTAYMGQNCGSNCQWTNITSSPTPTINVATLQWGELNFWSQSLSGQVRVPLSNCTQTFPMGSPSITTCDAPLNTTNVIFFAEDLVYPTDTIPSTFACYDNCPQVDGSGQAYINTMTSGPSNTATNYTFNQTSMLLMTTGTATVPVVMSLATSTNPYGVMSGALFDPTSANLAALDCNWDWDNNPATNPQVCGWKAWSALDVFYTWETGPDSWNQFSALKDGAGAFLTFEPPLSVKYVHNKAPYIGATFMLDYSGFGNLNGIPGKCVDMDSGLEVQCSSSSTVRYVPAFVIPPTQADGTLTKVTVDTTEYLVKPLELEQRMMSVDLGNCSSLSVTPYALPDLATEWTDPAIGTEPMVTAAPAVIGGVVQ